MQTRPNSATSLLQSLDEKMEAWKLASLGESTGRLGDV